MPRVAQHPSTYPRVLVAHPGTQHARHLARELHDRQLLHRFWTGFAIPEDGWQGTLLRLCPGRVRSRLGSRVMNNVPGTFLRTLPLIEWKALRALKRVDAETVFFERNRRFQEAIPDSEIMAADFIVGFDTSSWILARRAKTLGKRFILDQSIGHPAVKEQIFERLRLNFPAWSASISRKDDALIPLEREEHDLADLIVAPGDFVKETLVSEGVDEAKIHLIPYGTDLELFRPANRPMSTAGHPIVFLFVGGLTARKGLPVLLDAWRRLALTNAELWLVGIGTIPHDEINKLSSSVKILGHKNRREVSVLMQQADVFVFPTFFEGLALVQLEALASGLPVIATREGGADGLITDGENGFLVPAGDPVALARRMSQLAIDFSLRWRMQQAAEASRGQLGWHVYGQRWAVMLNELGTRKVKGASLPL